MEERRGQVPAGLLSRPLAEVAAIALLVVLFVERTAVSWRRWPDVVIDFGRELYTPWRLAEGAVLYRDVAHLSGPLSPAVNALWFRCFGVSLTTLAVANLALLAALVGGLYAVLRRALDALAAAAGCATLLVVFAFGHFVHYGNYNFVCPYSHELTHGILLLAVLLAAGECDRRGAGPWAAALAGVCLGLLFLGKPETSLAGLAVALAGLLLPRRGSRSRAIGWMLLGAAVPLILCFGIFATVLPLREAGDAILAAWRPVLAGRPANNEYYRRLLGFDVPVENLLRLARGAACGGLVVAAALLAGRAWRAGLRPALLAAAGACAVGAWLLRGDDPALFLAGAVVPGVVLATGVVALLLRREPGAAAVAACAVAALGLQAKVLLRPRIDHLGFALLLPAGVLAAVALVGLLPALLRRRGASARELAVVRVVACAVLLYDLEGWRSLADHHYRAKVLPVGAGGDLMYAFPPPADWRGQATAAVLDWFHHQAPPGDLAVFPDAAMLNYLLRRPSPVPHAIYMPAQMAYYGEDAIAEELRRHPPALLVVYAREFAPFGLPPFGAPGNGDRILQWVRQEYEPAFTIRGPPAGSGPPPLLLTVLRRKA
jgi:hypothetical protein